MDTDIADILGKKYTHHIDIGKGDIDPPLFCGWQKVKTACYNKTACRLIAYTLVSVPVKTLISSMGLSLQHVATFHPCHELYTNHNSRVTCKIL